jgi:guanine deaminase
MATGGGADALDLGDRIGRVAAGYDADLVVVDLHATPLLAFRMRYVADIDEALGVLLALGDDRAVRATYVDGHIAFDRDAPL